MSGENVAYKPGDWVVMLPDPQPVDGDQWSADDPDEFQPGCTYCVATAHFDSGEHWVCCPEADTGAYSRWLRPATRDEIAKAQLGQLAGL